MEAFEPAVVRMDQQTCRRSEATQLLGQENSSALVVEPDNHTVAPLAPAQAFLPLWVSLTNVVPKAREKGKVPTAEGTSQIARKPGNATQMFGEELSLAVSVCRMGVEAGFQGLVFSGVHILGVCFHAFEGLVDECEDDEY